MTQLMLTVDDSEMVRFLSGAASALDGFIGIAAEELREDADRESSDRGVTWHTTDEGVQADQFFAHFIARGTQGHGPVRAQHLVFDVDGTTVFARYVRGVPADPFHERAAATTGSRADQIIARAIAEVV